jgi:hypothetical protein
VRFAAQEPDSQARSSPLRVVLASRRDLVVSKTAQDAGFRLEPGQPVETRVQGIAPARNQVAGDQGDVRACIVGHVDDVVQIRFREKRAQVDVAELDQADPVEILGQPGDRDIDFLQLKARPLDKHAEAQRRYGRGEQRRASRAQHGPAPGIMRDGHAAPDQRRHEDSAGAGGPQTGRAAEQLERRRVRQSAAEGGVRDNDAKRHPQAEQPGTHPDPRPGVRPAAPGRQFQQPVGDDPVCKQRRHQEDVVGKAARRDAHARNNFFILLSFPMESGSARQL